MSWQEIMKDYVEKIPIFPSLPKNYSGEELYEFFKNKAQISELEAINTVRFQRKFKEYVSNGETYQDLRVRFKEISELSQKLFDRHFPAEK